MKNPPPPPKSKAALKPTAEPERTKASGKDGFSRVIQSTSGRSVLNALDTLFPENRKKTALTASGLGAPSAVPTSHGLKPPGRGKKVEIKFSDDNIKGSAPTHGPSILEVINRIRSPSPDFGSDDMDDLIRAAPDSALDADMYNVALDLAVGDGEGVSSPPDVPQASRKRLRDLATGPDPTAKRMKRISDWQGDVERRTFKPARSGSVQEVGAPSTDVVLRCLLTPCCYVGYQLNLPISFSTPLPSRKQRWEGRDYDQC